MGGVHIIPIYGAKGCEDKYIHYLSPQWMDMLRHVVKRGQAAGHVRRHDHRHRLVLRRTGRYRRRRLRAAGHQDCRT